MPLPDSFVASAPDSGEGPATPRSASIGPSFLEGPDAGIFVGHEPSWLVRSGISLVALTLALGFLFAALIRYPDVIQAPITLTTAEPPVELVSRMDGRIDRILVQDRQMVAKGRPLVLLAGDAESDRLRLLEGAVAALQNHLVAQPLEDFDSSLFEIGGLGSLQPGCNRLAEALRKHGRFHRSPYVGAEHLHTAAQRRRFLSLQLQVEEKRESFKRKLAMQQKLLDDSRHLAEQGLMPKAQLAPAESRVLDQELALDDLAIQAETYGMQLEDLEHRLHTLELQRRDEGLRLAGDVRNRLRELTSAMAAWRRQHQLTAPVEGRVTLTRFWSAHQEVKRGEVVLILSRDQGPRLGKLMVHQAGAGKIRAGQRVDIRLESFPAVEFGVVEARVDSVALVPAEQGYRVDVALPDPFVTTHRHRLPFTPNMTGTARIVTEDRLLLERIFDKLIYLIQPHGS